MDTHQNNEALNSRCGIRRYPIKCVIVTFIIIMFLPIQAFAQNDPTEPIPAADELCAKAIKAKFQSDLASKCEAYNLFKKANDAGIKDPRCQKQANVYIAAYASECDSAPMPSTAHTPSPMPSVDVDELCSEAIKAKFQSDLPSKCKAYNLYKKAKKAGIKDPKCQKAANVHIAAYASECDSAPSTTPMPSTAHTPSHTPSVDV
ncbi:MAG: hypothetical protein II180_12855, partial [Proteobacteria bacterium]|nr:hypothetical protein [Pseudomonadota bacterium]